MHSKWLFRVHWENDCDKYSRQMSHTMLHPINVKTGKNWLQFIVDSFESISKSFHFVFIFRWIRRQNHTLTMHWHSHQATKSFQSKCSYCSSSAKWRHLVWGYNWSRGWYDKSPSTRFATNAKELAKEQTQKKKLFALIQIRYHLVRFDLSQKFSSFGLFALFSSVYLHTINCFPSLLFYIFHWFAMSGWASERGCVDKWNRLIRFTNDCTWFAFTMKF